jgi:hypothetical protein
MENLKIKIVITDGEKEARAEIPVKDYKTVKELHGESLVDMQVEVLLNEISKSIESDRFKQHCQIKKSQ